MATYLVCSSPIHGHVSPMLAIAKHLVACGHDVSVLTGSRFRQDIENAGATPRALQGLADFDDRVFLNELPDLQHKRAIARVSW
jgi:UDP:flavonoid glycosyltransferase YjiC (YdhE family)